MATLADYPHVATGKVRDLYAVDGDTLLDAGAIAEGTGPGGRVIERDVKAALEAGPDATRAAARAWP